MSNRIQTAAGAKVRAAWIAGVSPRGIALSPSAAVALIEIIVKIQQQLGPHLIHPRYRCLRPKTANSSWGCCYPATEALYHLWGRARGFKPHYIRIKSGCHWFLKNQAGQIVDPTVTQFKGSLPDYSKAVGAGFLTKEPSKRARLIMEQM